MTTMSLRRPVPTRRAWGAATMADSAPVGGLVVVAVLAISSSAVLVRLTEVPPGSLAFWRTAGGALVLAPLARTSARLRTRQWLLLVVAGAALGVHFAAWLASLELTSVAASVTLVTTAPLMIAAGSMVTGRRPPPTTWIAILIATIGAVVISVGGAEPGGGASSPALGNLLALIGAAAMAIYLVAGDRLRLTLSTASYAARAYGVAAVGLGSVGVATGQLTPSAVAAYDRRDWLVIGAMIVGPQLGGHTVLNLLLRRLGSVTTSMFLLLEPLGATILVWLLLSERPPVAALVGAPLVIGAVALQLRRGSSTGAVNVSGADRRGSVEPELGP